MGFTEPGRSPGLLVSSYLTVSPLPPTIAGGGLFSVALSLAFRPVGVTHHRTLWSPDFPPATADLARDVPQLDGRSRRPLGPLRFHIEMLHSRRGQASRVQDTPRRVTFRTRQFRDCIVACGSFGSIQCPYTA